ncbi:MAG: ATP-binding protein, partial [Vicinamibacterales bacterium]
MKLLDRVRRTIERHRLAAPDTGLVAAVSGGSDSVALAALLHELTVAGELRLLGLAHFNHQLRAEAGYDEQSCADLAARLGVGFLADREDVRARARAERRSIEHAARVARYEFFERARRYFGADV